MSGANRWSYPDAVETARWPRDPVRVGKHAWFYIQGDGLEIFIELNHNAQRVASAVIPWAALFSAMGWWRRLRAKRARP